MISQTETTMDADTLQKLKARVRGQVLVPGDERYDSARKVYNLMIDKKPALIV